MRNVEAALRRAGGRSISAGSIEAAKRFRDRAARTDLIDVAYTEVDSPFGPMLVASTPRGLVRVAFRTEPFAGVIEDMAERISPRLLAVPSRLDRVRRELDQYFAGKRKTFEVPLDWRLSRGFQQRVLRATYRIPYGRTSTYREMAAKAGNARAMRAAGSALGSNPIPIVVPCHRVLRTGGALGGYGGGLPMKEALLKLEGALE